uniref:Uncharacterized protein n=1 Tax=Schistosoma curassoni TaxID=6186 RepID=A0A183K0S4_9TREM
MYCYSYWIGQGHKTFGLYSVVFSYHPLDLYEHFELFQN